MKSRVFPGWYVVGAAHVLLTLIFGAAYSFGAFFVPIQDSFAVGRFSVASVFSLTAFIYYGAGVFSGTLADRTSPRAVVGAGVVLLALGFFFSSYASGSLSLFIALFCSLVGLGVGLVYVPLVATVQRWFVIQRNQASGIALAGTGVGTFIGPVAAGLLMQHLSWESTLRIFALVIALVGLPMALLVRRSPQALGLLPDGARPGVGAPGPGVGTSQGMRLGEALGTARFWCYFVAIFLGSVGLFSALVHINPYARALGVSSAQANLFIGLIGVGNIVGRLFLGRLGDRIGAHRLLLVLTLILGGLNGLWLGAQTPVTLGLFALLFGLANGGCIALYPSVAAGWFGTANLGAILGALYVSVGIAALAGGSLGGLLFDLYQSYSATIALGALCALASAAFLQLAVRRNSSAPIHA